MKIEKHPKKVKSPVSNINILKEEYYLSGKKKGEPYLQG